MRIFLAMASVAFFAGCALLPDPADLEEVLDEPEEEMR